MNIYDMIVGRRYLIGDGLGYDIVTCIDKVGDVVKVRTDEGVIIDLFESKESSYVTYVEPR